MSNEGILMSFIRYHNIIYKTEKYSIKKGRNSDQSSWFIFFPSFIIDLVNGMVFFSRNRIEPKLIV